MTFKLATKSRSNMREVVSSSLSRRRFRPKELWPANLAQRGLRKAGAEQSIVFQRRSAPALLCAYRHTPWTHRTAMGFKNHPTASPMDFVGIAVPRDPQRNTQLSRYRSTSKLCLTAAQHPRNWSKMMIENLTALVTKYRPLQFPQPEVLQALDPEKSCVHSREKVLRAISEKEADNVIRALRHAQHLGLLPNRHITIDWELAGVEDPVRAMGRLLKLMKDAARKRGWLTSHIWSQENGKILGQHVHLLIHMSADDNEWLKRHMAGWLKKCGAVRKKGACRSRKIAGSNYASKLGENSEWYKANLERVVAYVLKHCSGQVAKQLGRVSAGKTQVIGKQLSISQNINRKAQNQCALCSRVISTPKQCN
jgi:hypothetical protein